MVRRRKRKNFLSQRGNQRKKAKRKKRRRRKNQLKSLISTYLKILVRLVRKSKGIGYKRNPLK